MSEKPRKKGVVAIVAYAKARKRGLSKEEAKQEARAAVAEYEKDV